MFDMLYVQGYTAALQDVLKVFDYIQDDLKRRKRKQDYKTYKEIVNTMLQNRAELRENPDAFIRCEQQGFSLYEDR